MGQRELLALFGEPAKVQFALEDLEHKALIKERLLDDLHSAALGYRLVVLKMPDGPTLPIRWMGAQLPHPSHSVIDNGSTVASASSVGQFVTFGPYVALDPGRYVVTVRYSISDRTTSGSLDAFSVGEGVIAETSLPSTSGAIEEKTLAFQVTQPGKLWEFRTSAVGTGSFTLAEITVDVYPR